MHIWSGLNSGNNIFHKTMIKYTETSSADFDSMIDRVDMFKPQNFR